jgi:hypothetical protein
MLYLLASVFVRVWISFFSFASSPFFLSLVWFVLQIVIPSLHCRIAGSFDSIAWLTAGWLDTLGCFTKALWLCCAVR